MPLVHALASPNLAYVLFVAGCYGLLVELLHPGGLFPGLSGGICLALGIVAFSLLHVHPLGAVVLVAAVTLFVLDGQVAGHGGFTLLGAAGFLAGSLLLSHGPGGAVHGAVALPLVLGVTAAAAILGAVLVRVAFTVRRMPPLSPTRLLLGTTGVVISPLKPHGTVQAGGALWSARLRMETHHWKVSPHSSGGAGRQPDAPDVLGPVTPDQEGQCLLPGEEVRIVGRRGLILEVEPLAGAVAARPLPLQRQPGTRTTG